jgi:hypothetical protein
LPSALTNPTMWEASRPVDPLRLLHEVDARKIQRLDPVRHLGIDLPRQVFELVTWKRPAQAPQQLLRRHIENRREGGRGLRHVLDLGRLGVNGVELDRLREGLPIPIENRAPVGRERDLPLPEIGGQRAVFIGFDRLQDDETRGHRDEQRAEDEEQADEASR